MTNQATWVAVREPGEVCGAAFCLLGARDDRLQFAPHRPQGANAEEAHEKREHGALPDRESNRQKQEFDQRRRRGVDRQQEGGGGRQLVQLARGCILDPGQPPGRQSRREDGAGEGGGKKDIRAEIENDLEQGFQPWRRHSKSEHHRRPLRTATAPTTEPREARLSSHATSGRNSTVTVPSAPVDNDGQAAGRRRL